MSNDIIAVQDGPALRITINRPEHGNVASDAMAVELTRMLLAAEESSRFVVLRGAGADFCAGRATMGPPPGPRPEALALRRRNDVVFDCYGAFRRCALPIVAAVQGRAHGFGCALAALADITLAAEDSSFALPEMAHSIMPTMVMSALVDRVGLKALQYLVYSTAEITAARALSFGIVSEIVPKGSLDDALATLTAALAKAPQPALLAVKEYAGAARSMGIAGAVDFARNLHATINSSSEMRR
jgi:enoyl-CoA hydratase